MSDEIRLNSVEEDAALKAANSLPRGVRAMPIGNKIIFVRFARNGKWMPVSAKMQFELEKKHILNDTAGS